MPRSLFVVMLVLLGASFSCAPSAPAQTADCPCVSTEVRCPQLATVDVSAADVADSEPEQAEPESPIPIGADDPKWGDSDALVTILYASDFECPFCSRVVPTLDSIREQYGPDKVRFVFKHNPLPFHKRARPAHYASVVVHRLGGDQAFWKFHHLAFENSKALTDENFELWAEMSGVSRASFRRAMRTAEVDSPQSPRRKIDWDLDRNREIGIMGTPAFRINGATLSGAQPLAKFQAEIDQQLVLANKLMAGGIPRRLVSAAATVQNFEEPEDDERAEPKLDTTEYRVTVGKDDPQRGPSDALVTIIMFSDFQCPFCQRVNATLDALLKEYGKDVRLVWKDNPLPFHKEARPAANLARVALAQKGQSGFWAAHDALFENQKDFGEETFKSIAAELKLPWWRVKQAIDKDKYQDVFDSAQELAEGFNARGTPSFFINGRKLSGAQPIEKFRELIDEQLTRAKAMIEAGVPRAKLYDKILEKAEPIPEPERRNVPAPTKQHPRRGAKHPKVVIQAFEDFQCPFCSRAKPTLEQVLKEHPYVQIVWRHMPLPFHKQADLAAEASHEVFLQQGDKGFWKYHDKLMENQRALEREDLERYAEQQAVDMKRFRKALDERTHSAHVEADKQVAQQAGINGTPSFTINGYFLSGAQPYGQFKKLIKYALQQGKP